VKTVYAVNVVCAFLASCLTILSFVSSKPSLKEFFASSTETEGKPSEENSNLAPAEQKVSETNNAERPKAADADADREDGFVITVLKTFAVFAILFIAAFLSFYYLLLYLVLLIFGKDMWPVFCFNLGMALE
jgi:hypothetical protein